MNQYQVITCMKLTSLKQFSIGLLSEFDCSRTVANKYVTA